MNTNLCIERLKELLKICSNSVNTIRNYQTLSDSNMQNIAQNELIISQI